jgi:hypothetical protein
VTRNRLVPWASATVLGPTSSAWHSGAALTLTARPPQASL